MQFIKKRVYSGNATNPNNISTTQNTRKRCKQNDLPQKFWTVKKKPLHFNNLWQYLCQAYTLKNKFLDNLVIFVNLLERLQKWQANWSFRQLKYTTAS